MPLHAEVHGYNEWHGAQDKSHIVLLQILSLTTFLWTPGIDCVVTKHMNVYVYDICYLETDTTHSYNFRLPNSFFL